MKQLTEQQLQRLLEAARAASRHAYSPYSRFAVGAAAFSEDGKLYAGCNVENASYGLSLCAERNAIFQMVADGRRELQALAIYTPTPEPTAPCGACRQVAQQFGRGCRVIGVCDGAERIDTTLDQLLPAAFGPDSLPPNHSP